MPQFCGTCKVHKGRAPKLRPIASCVNSAPEIFSKWVDCWLKQAIREHLPTCLRDAEHLISELKSSFPNGLPKGAHLFSMDAVGMHSNVDTKHGVEMTLKYLTDCSDSLTADMPIDFITAALKEIMQNNIFQFGDTHWRQAQGSAMGTSTAVNCACLCVGVLELQRLLKKHGISLQFFKQFIDDIIGVWLPDPNNPTAWTDFFCDINDCGQLKWTCDGLTNELMFMDLHVKLLPNGQLEFATCQKDMNSCTCASHQTQRTHAACSVAWCLVNCEHAVCTMQAALTSCTSQNCWLND